MSHPTRPRTRAKTISRLERRPNSRYGNPSYEVVFTDGTTARTQTDAAVAFWIDNPEYRDVPVWVSFTPAGRIYDVEVASDE